MGFQVRALFNIVLRILPDRSNNYTDVLSSIKICSHNKHVVVFYCHITAEMCVCVS